MSPQKPQSQSILADMPPAKAIVSLAVPTTLALLAKAVYNLVDTAYIGMLKADIALTAVGVTVPLLLIMVSVENIFAAGAAVLAGRQLGADLPDGAVPRLRPVLHDDHHQSDHWGFPVRAVPFRHPSGAFLHSVHSDPAQAAGCQRHLRFPAGCRHTDGADMRFLHSCDETGRIPEHAAGRALRPFRASGKLLLISP